MLHDVDYQSLSVEQCDWGIYESCMAGILQWLDTKMLCRS